MPNSLDETKHLDLGDAGAAAPIDKPPDTFLSFAVLALLAPASVFGVLARLGLIALTNFDGHSVFPLAYVQAVGCLVMGFGLRLKASLVALYVASSWFCEYLKFICYQLFPLVHSTNNR